MCGGDRESGWRTMSSNRRSFRAFFLGIAFTLCLFGSSDAWKSLITPQDLLPALPHSLSWPVLNSVHSAVDLLPKFVGALASKDDNVTWKGACFYENEAYFEYVEPKEEGKRGGGILHIKVVIYCELLLLICGHVLCHNRYWLDLFG